MSPPLVGSILWAIRGGVSLGRSYLFRALELSCFRAWNRWTVDVRAGHQLRAPASSVFARLGARLRRSEAGWSNSDIRSMRCFTTCEHLAVHLVVRVKACTPPSIGPGLLSVHHSTTLGRACLVNATTSINGLLPQNLVATSSPMHHTRLASPTC